MFSTDLGRLAPRRLQGPPHVPVLARSDMVRDVITAAGLWRNKYPYQYLCIFPRCGWRISDLWDEEDIHLETEPFCKEVLQFIERDNCVRAQKYAQDWSKMHPECLPIVGGDMTELYDKSDPLSIVNRIFVNEERREYPPIFLWHVAHIMRTTMLTVKGTKLQALEVVNVYEHVGMGQETPLARSTAHIPATAGVTATLPTVPSTTTNCKTSREIRRRRNVTDMAVASTHVVGPASTSGSQPTSTWHTDRTSPPTHGHAADPIAGGSYAEPTGHMMPTVPGYQPGNAVHSALRVPRNRPGRSTSGTYSRITPSSPYVENMPRVPSGLGPRQHASPMPMMQSPQFNQAHMAMNHLIGNVHSGMVPFAYEQAPMPCGMIAGPPPPPGAIHPGMVLPHTVHSPSTTHGYSRQPSGSQNTPYAAPMGDMTNRHYFPGMPPQNIDLRRPNDHPSSQQRANGSGLYDPYEGSNPAFRAAGYSSGKKYNQNGLHNSNGRQRKTSFPGSRPYQGQYTNDRPGLLQMGSNNFSGPKPHLEDDLAITQDREYGCYIDWIGPHNDTVNELFVKDLPVNVQDAELEALFHDRLGIRPTSINVRSALHAQQAQGRKHAFVG